MSKFCRQFILSCFCCHHCPVFCKSKVSNSTRVGYFCIYFAAITLSIIVSMVKSLPLNLPFCYDDDTFVCEKYPTCLAVNRVYFPFILFFLTMWLLTIEISSSRNPRAVIHNGFWFQKILFIALLLVAFSFVPYGWFDVILMWVCCIVLVGFHNYELFALCQIAVNIAYLCYEKLWVRNSCCKFICTLGIVLISLYGLLIGIFLLFMYNKCPMNVILISVNLSLAYIVGIIMALVRIRRREKVEAIQSTVLTSFLMIITWSAIANNPREDCNPKKELSITFFTVVKLYCLWIAGICVFVGLKYLLRDVELSRQDAIVLLEERGKECCCGIWGRPMVVDTVSVPGDDMPTTRVVYMSVDESDDEYELVKYAWSAFHHILLNGSFYLMFHISDNFYLHWETEVDTPVHFNETAMWSKLISTWFCLILFVLAGLIKRKYIY